MVDNTNNLTLIGTIKSIEELYTHAQNRKYNKETFYQISLIVPRLSGTEDCLPIVVSEKLLYNVAIDNLTGKIVTIKGILRSRNYFDERVNKVPLPCESL